MAIKISQEFVAMTDVKEEVADYFESQIERQNNIRRGLIS